MSLLPDPITDLIGLFIGKKFKDAVMQKVNWLTDRIDLGIEMVLVYVMVFSIFAGAPLMAHASWGVAIGSGMVSAGLAMFGTFQASRHSRGLTITVQQKVPEQKMDTPMSTIERN